MFTTIAMIAAALTFGSMTCPHYGLVPKGFDENLRFRRDVLELARTDPAEARNIRKMCAEDLLFYVNTFCWTYAPKMHPDTPVMPFITYEEFQDEAMLSIGDCIQVGRDFSMPKSRDMGASWMGLTVFEWFWHFREHQSFLVISRNEKYVDDSGNPKTLFWKIDFLHKNQPRWLLPTGRWLGDKDPARRQLHLSNADNSSVIDGESTTGDAGRGDRRTAMFIDEHAAFELNDGFRVLRATRDTTNCRGFNSTPQGAANAFFEVVHHTAARQIRLHWSSHPEKNEGLYTTAEDGTVKLLDDFRGTVEVFEKGEKDGRSVAYPDDYPFRLDGKMRSPWYDGECARCVTEAEIGQELDIDFLGSDFQFFDPVTIDKLTREYCRAPTLIGDLEFDSMVLTPKRFTENPKGSLLLWLPLDKDGRVPVDMRFAIGSDVSAGTGASNSVSSVVDRATGEKVGVWRCPHTRPGLFADTTVALARFFNKAFMVWDASGPTGKTFTMSVIDRNYGNIYYRRNEKKAGQDVTDEPGYFLNTDARGALLEDYRAALGAHDFINPSETGMKETLQFVVQPGGKVEHSAAVASQDPTGARTAHGDEVIADALAFKGLSERSQHNKQAEKPEAPVGSLAWRQEQKAAAEKQTGGDLGENWG